MPEKYLQYRQYLVLASKSLTSKLANRKWFCQVEAALAPLRDGEGFLKPILPRHWRFKAQRVRVGKLIGYIVFFSLYQ